jgi:hypothetical protein
VSVLGPRVVIPRESASLAYETCSYDRNVDVVQLDILLAPNAIKSNGSYVL